MSVVVDSVEQGSIGEKHGFAPGDVLLRMDGHDIDDVLDYRFYMVNARVSIEGTTAAGEPFVRAIRKGQYDDLGLAFDTYLMDKQRFCKNKCVFCFIDQLPQGLRESLYFKDDDSRMSFLFGNYITLTNLAEKDVRRILDMHISPINVSVHTTDPALRVRMMKNPGAGKALQYLPMLAEGGIKINAQLVLCPGYNDGAALERSIGDLCDLAPGLQSVAVVPVGITKFRDGLEELRLFDREGAAAVIATVDRFGDEMQLLHGTRICYAADEFYLVAGQPIPPAAHYEEFAQLENGVGMLASLTDEFDKALALEDARPLERRATIATGRAARPFLTAMAGKAMACFPGLRVDVVQVDNDFFGHTITVAGLVTGGDIAAQLSGRDLGDALLLPAAMLRHERDLFLDGVGVDELSARLGVPIRLVEDDGFDLLDAMLGNAPV